MHLNKIIIYFILCFSLTAKAQNLISNPSFELHSSCPNQMSQIGLCNSWNDGDTHGTCDYYSALNCTGNFSPPLIRPTGYLNFYQQPLSGNSFAGFIPYYSPNYTLPAYVEFLQGKFNIPLILNQLYYVEFYINSASQMKYFIHDIAALITDTLGFINTNNLQNYNPQILPMPGVIYKDTTKWMRINGFYTAHGGENYITIGNYKPNGQELKDSASSIYSETYYFVDSVGVYKVTQWNAWNAGPDKTINSGDSVQIGNPCSDYSMFSWVTSIGTQTYLTDSTISWPYAKPTQNTTYYVTKTQGTTVFKDTVNVFVNGSGINSFSNNELFNIYPNPSNGIITTELKTQNGITNYEIRITDVLGNVIKTQEIKNKEEIIDISNLSEGIYFVSTETVEGVVTNKIIIQH